RDRIAGTDRSADQPGEADLPAVTYLSQVTLCDERGDALERAPEHRKRAAVVEGGAGQRRQADRSTALVAAHHVRSGDDPQHRVLPRDRELFAALFRPASGTSPADAAGLSAVRCAAVPGRKPSDRSATGGH